MINTRCHFELSNTHIVGKELFLGMFMKLFSEETGISISGLSKKDPSLPILGVHHPSG
jgi:hypothetical protein